MTDHTFPLAPLRRFDPNGIVGDVERNDLQAFILALAAAFNDLKGLIIWQGMLHEWKSPKAAAITGHNGQYTGLEIQTTRLVLAQLHELLVLIATFETEARGAEITAILSHAVPQTRREWRELVDVATDKGGGRDRALTSMLRRIRHTAAYHYYQPKALVKGFRRHFYETAKGPHNEVAYASTGTNMERTRFYSADAAYSALLQELGESVGTEQFSRRVRRLADTASQTIAFIVSRYIAASEK